MNITLKDLVQLIGINYEKYNKNEKRIIGNTMILLSETEMTDEVRGMYLYEFKNILDELNSLLDNNDDKSKIGRDYVDNEMLNLCNLLSRNNSHYSVNEKTQTEDASVVKQISSIVKAELGENKSAEETKEDKTLDVDSETENKLIRYFNSEEETKSQEIDDSESVEVIDSDNDEKVETVVVNTKNDDKRIKIERGILIVSSLALLASIFTTGYVLIKHAKDNKDKDNNKDDKGSSMSSVIENNNNSTMYDSRDNVLVIEDNDENDKLVLVEEISEPLTTENFNNLVNTIETKFAEKSLAVSKEDVRKFAMIINIDELAQDNKELINEIIGSQNTEEVFGDADDVIDTIMSYNYQYYYDDEDAILEAYLANKPYKHSIDGFVKLSDFIYNKEQKEIVMEIESRISEINNSVDDNEKMNELVHTLLKDMISATSKLSMLEDGVNYAVEWVYIELIRGLFGMDLDGNCTLDATNADLVKYYVSYVEDDKAYYDNASVNGSVRNINNLLNDCKEKTLTK